MPSSDTNQPIVIATRGSALALTQSRYVQARLQSLLPDVPFQIEIFKTKGDQLQSRAPEDIPANLPKGLFTKELETALLEKRADLAVHSLKDLPTELPEGLEIAAVSPREDVREVLLLKQPLDSGEDEGNPLAHLPDGAKIGTGSPRRQAFLTHANDRLQCVPIRGNVPTRIQKLADSPDLDGIILAAAGLKRLGYKLPPTGPITGNDAPESIFASILPINTIIPCVGQGAIGLETRSKDPRIEQICHAFNDPSTHTCIVTERTFLAAMGGGCQSPVAAYASLDKDQLHLIAANVGGSQFKMRDDRTSASTGPELASRFAEELR